MLGLLPPGDQPVAVSLAISRYADGGLFDYVEPDLRTPVLVAAVAEIIAILTLAAGLLAGRRAA